MNEDLNGVYYLYYQTKNIKYLYKQDLSSSQCVYMMKSEEDIDSYKSQSSNNFLYNALESEIDFFSGRSKNTTSAYYRISFFHDGLDWKDSISQKTGAKAVINFSGPRIHSVWSKTVLLSEK